MKGFFRINEWWNSKIVALIGIAYVFSVYSDVAILDFAHSIGFLLIWMVLSAAFGYYINDVFDLKKDIEVDKENHSQGHSVLLKTVLSFTLVASIYLSWFLLSKSILILILITTQLLLFYLYSTPFIRLKEKPIVGVVTDALYAHFIPGFIVLFCILSIEVRLSILVLFGIWQLFVGIRNILAHHLVDFDNDSESGTITSVTHYGKARVTKFMNYLISPLEIIALLVLLLLLGNPLYFLIPVYIFYIIYTYGRELIFVRENKTSWTLKEQESYNFIGGVLLNEFYEKWFPIIVLGILCYFEPFFAIIAATHLILFHKTVYDFKKDYMIVKNIILSRIYWWFVRNFYKYFLHPVYYNFFGKIKHFIYWKLYARVKDVLYWQVFGFIYFKMYGKLKHFVYWKIYKPLSGKNE